MFAGSTNFRFNWKLTLFTVLMLPALLRLGFWQLEREQEKLHLQDLYTARQQEQSVDLGSLEPEQDLQYRQVYAAGSYDNNHVFLLDNRIYQGQAGYEVIVPLLTTDGQVAFINRGWLPQGSYRDQLPDVPIVSGPVAIEGSIYVPVGEQLVLGTEIAAPGWPKVIQTLDVAGMFTLAGYDTASQLFPYSVRLDENSPGVLTRYWPVISTTPEKHRAYAVQWFAMAAVLLGLFLHSSLRRRSNKLESEE